MSAPSPNMKPDELRANDAFSSQAQLFAWLQCSQEKSKIKDGESIHPASILVIKKKRHFTVIVWQLRVLAVLR